MPPVGFEPTISAGERPKTYALDRAATGTGYLFLFTCSYLLILSDVTFYIQIRPQVFDVNQKLCRSVQLVALQETVCDRKSCSDMTLLLECYKTACFCVAL